MDEDPKIPGVQLEIIEQSVPISWAVPVAIALVVLLGAVLLFWMFSGRRRDD